MEIKHFAHIMGIHYDTGDLGEQLDSIHNKLIDLEAKRVADVSLRKSGEQG